VQPPADRDQIVEQFETVGVKHCKHVGWELVVDWRAIAEESADIALGMVAATPAPVPAQGTPPAQPTHWLLFFEESGKEPWLYTDELSARRAYADAKITWNCHLFQQVESSPTAPVQPKYLAVEVRRVLNEHYWRDGKGCSCEFWAGDYNTWMATHMVPIMCAAVAFIFTTPAPASPQVGETLEQELDEIVSMVAGDMRIWSNTHDKSWSAKFLHQQIMRAVLPFIRTKLRAALAESHKRASKIEEMCHERGVEGDAVESVKEICELLDELRGLK
jgi:hypothetical protein